MKGRRKIRTRSLDRPTQLNPLNELAPTFGAQHYRTGIIQIILLTWEDCNFRCKYCYEKFARGTMKPEVRQGIKKLVAERAQQLRELPIS